MKAGRVVALVMALAVVLYLIGSVFLPIVSGIDARLLNKRAPDRFVILVAGPIHYDILIPIDDAVRDRFGWLVPQGAALDHPDAKWLVMGWGAREFYTTTGSYGDVSAAAVAKAVFGDTSVMRVDVLGDVDEVYLTRPVPMNDAQQKALFDAIEASFAQGAAAVALTQSGLTASDVFFPAKGRFNILNTCNVWIGRMMRQSGVPFGMWTPAPYSVTLAYNKFVRP